MKQQKLFWSAFLVLASFQMGLLAEARAQVEAPPASSEQQSAPAGTAGPDQASQIPAQVHTGTRSSDKAIAPLFALLADHQYLKLQAALDQQQADDATYFRGILANRENQSEESLKLLLPLLPSIVASNDPEKEKTLRLAIAEDYLRTFQYPQAAAAFADYEQRYGSSMTQQEKDDIEIPLRVLPLVKDLPPQTVETDGNFSIPFDRSPMGLSEITVYVDGNPRRWVFDPTAAFNMISRSTARIVGLKVSVETSVVHSLTGRDITVHSAIIPRLKFQRATFHNVAVMVYDDEDLAYPQYKYKVQGILGLPALSALGKVTILPATQRIEVSDDKPLRIGAHFFLESGAVFVAEGARGQERMYSLDAGGTQTFLTSRYYDEHMGDFENQKPGLLRLTGSENAPPLPAQMAGSLSLTFGAAPVTFHDVQVITQPRGELLDTTYGTLGADSLDQLLSYTFDFRNMRFSVVQPE